MKENLLVTDDNEVVVRPDDLVYAEQPYRPAPKWVVEGWLRSLESGSVVVGVAGTATKP